MIELQAQKTVTGIHTFGRVLEVNRTEFGINGRLENGFFEIQFFENSVVRIHVRRCESEDSNPYSVVQKPGNVEFDFEETESHLTLITTLLKIEINKSEWQCRVFNSSGNLISEDDPGLNTSIQGEQLTLYRKLFANERFIGLGEKTGNLDRRGSGYTHWNTDHFAYELESDPIYASIPFFIGIHEKGQYGLFLNNSYKSHFNFGASNNRFSSVSVDSGDLDYFLIVEDEVKDIIRSYSTLTGKMPLPPIWSLGYQQCRYSYYPQGEVLRIADKFRDQKIPADVIVLDIHYMEKFKIFSWDGEKFPDPKAMISHLKDKGFEVVVICDPGIKEEKGYGPYESGIDKDIFLKYPDGEPYTGEVWPGWCHFPDFTKSTARNWWKHNLEFYTSMGIKGFWNDMNEIATWGQMLPDNIIFDFEDSPATTRKGRNIYGHQMAKSSYEGAKENLGERPFNLTRAGFAGIQRYAAMWTGDNVANDEHMLLGVRLVNSLGLSGVPFAGYDVGGFAGNGDSRLFARWIQLGAFSPFFRGHSMINSHASEPWSYGEEVEEISRNFIRLRYKFLPYLYQAFKEASKSGLPISRSLAIDFPHQESVYDEEFQNQYLFGENILVAPLESQRDIGKVWLPEGTWYDLFTGEKFEGDQIVFNECGIERLPVFVKASSILLSYSQVGQSTAEIGEQLEIHLYAGETSSSAQYYEDDGRSFDFEQEGFYQRELLFAPEDQLLTIQAAEGGYSSRMKTIKVVMHGFTSDKVHINDERISPVHEEYRFIEPISNFDPVETKQKTTNEPVTSFTFNSIDDQITVRF